MKFRKMLLLVLTFTLLSGTVAYAADSIGQKIRIWINKKEVDSTSILVDKQLYISSDLIGDKLQGILLWDEKDKKINIYRPNVHMLSRNGSTIFGEVNKGSKFKFNIFAQVDSLKVDLSAFKLTITEPYGEETLIEARTTDDSNFPDKGKDNFWITTRDILYSFDSAGVYTIKFWMRPSGETTYQLVSEKAIMSR
ncbi:MAG: copper amine oxidase [Candidatus Cohnella colombiensis]|uniref:Copper amine oxidase n=1 Tax=Candidatus Cohnella colombiensis TaxID=3121368 RepID=A0AA95F1E9_9BACL|nr:MAG: copper amine oxidase [Cohnella sp.]